MITRLTPYKYILILITFTIWGWALYYNSLPALWSAWQTQEFGHGILLPFIAMIWGIYLLQKSPIALRPSYFGLLIILGGLSINALGILISNNWISNLSLVIFITGVLWSFLGMQAIKRISPALILLLFAIPLPATMLPALTADLQLMSSSMGVGMLHTLGIAAYQEGNIIDLGTYKLDVAIACSGLQYLFPLLSLSYLMSAFLIQAWWKKIVLFLSAIPISLGLNAARIGLSGVLYTYFGPESIEGTLHYIEGYMMFGLCLVCLFLVKYLLGLLPPQTTKSAFDTPFTYDRLNNNQWQKPSFSFCLILILIMGAFTATSIFISKQYASEHILPRKNFAFFPLEIGNWVGRKDRLPQTELDTLNLTDYFVGNYKYQGRDDFVPVNLYIAYYDKQTQENSIHSPRICLPGSGWIIASHYIHTVDGLQVNMEVLQRNNERLLIYYWFREAGYDAATNFDIKRLLLINSLRHGRTDGSLIRLTAPLKDDMSQADVQTQMDDFLKNVFPKLPHYIPPPSAR